MEGCCQRVKNRHAGPLGLCQADVCSAGYAGLPLAQRGCECDAAECIYAFGQAAPILGGASSERTVVLDHESIGRDEQRRLAFAHRVGRHLHLGESDTGSERQGRGSNGRES